MIAALMALLACQVAGELTARLLGLSIPGPVIGTILLFALLPDLNIAAAASDRVTPARLTSASTGNVANEPSGSGGNGSPSGRPEST